MNNIFISLCLFLPILSFAQSGLVTDEQDDDTDEININKIFEHLRSDPVDINGAKRSELTQFFFLSEGLIDKLLCTRPFRNKARIRELLGDELFELLEPYIQISTENDLDVVISTQITRTLDLYEPHFTGSMLAMTNSLRLRLHENISAGILIQKDAGEESFRDHWSGYIRWIGFQDRVHVIGGDFRLHVAQGLISSSLYSNHKSADVNTSFRPSSHDGRVALSSNENNTHRGLYLRFHSGSGIFCDAFYSYSLHDVNSEIITGISQNGYHRTPREQNFKDRLSLNGIGLRTEIDLWKNFTIGILFIDSKYNPAILQRNLNERRRTFFAFTGNALLNNSTFFSLHTDDLMLSGEVAYRDFNMPAGQFSCQIKEKSLKIGMRIWYIPADYYAPFSAYSEKLNNSCGFLFAVSQRLNSSIKLDAIVFTEKSLWRTYFNPLPILNKEYMIRSKFVFDHKTVCTVIYRHKLRQNYIRSLPGINLRRQHSVRLDIEKTLHQSLRVRVRFEYNYLQEKTATERGTNFFHDIRWSAAENLIFHIRYSSFYSPSYESRLYEFENELPYIFNSRSLFGKGIKWYLLIRWKYLNKVEVQFKFHLCQKYVDLPRPGYLDTNRESGLFIQYRW